VSLILATPTNDGHARGTLKQQLMAGLCQVTGVELPLPVRRPSAQMSARGQYQRYMDEDPGNLEFSPSRAPHEGERAQAVIRRNLHRLTMPVFMACAGWDTVWDNLDNARFFATLPAERKWLRTYAAARHILEFSPCRDEPGADPGQGLLAGRRHGSLRPLQ
jgi:hypothetical protein